MFILEQRTLPQTASKYSQTKVFTINDLPKGLMKNHATKPGVWGRLVVHNGTVNYVDVETGEKRDVLSGQAQVIAPESVHFIQPSPDASFHVEFHQ